MLTGEARSDRQTSDDVYTNRSPRGPKGTDEFKNECWYLIMTFSSRIKDSAKVCTFLSRDAFKWFPSV